MTASRRYWRFIAIYRYQLAAAIVAVTAGLIVGFLASELFSFHSANHDEGVYLQQAAMLLEGRLWLNPGSDALREAFHPWFFVESDRGLYAKYSPVPAAVFAAGKLLGGYRVALGLVATLNVALTYAVTTEAFDRRTGILAAIILTSAPLFLVTSAVFLPYAPTTALNLLFALSYIRAVRRHDHRYSVLAGMAVGLSFFARPYTAVLFAVPFLLHAARQLTYQWSENLQAGLHYWIIAGIGCLWVGVTIGYNALLTGNPLVFPYEAFAPHDGLGFGYRAILGHDTIYSPDVAVTANLTVLAQLATAWFTAGLVGTAAAITGMVIASRRIIHEGIESTTELSNRQLHLLLLALTMSVVIGNLFFWGNLNILGALSDPSDGLIALFGPFYHFDLLLPLAAFAASGIRSGMAQLEKHGVGLRDRRVGIPFLVCLVLTGVVIGGTAPGTFGPPVEKNAAYTTKYEQAYAPFTRTEFSHALVFLPPTYGEWRNHPFQWLRNDPGFDGPVVYALARSPSADFQVIDAYPERTLYRYRYHGTWTPDPDNHVKPLLERTHHRSAPTLRARTRISIPDRITSVTVSLSNEDTIQRYDPIRNPSSSLSVNWSVSPDRAAINDPRLTSESPSGIQLSRADELTVMLTITEPGGGTLTYRETVQLRLTDGTVEAIWPPASATCLLTTNCGSEGTYLPDQPETRPSGIRMNTTLVSPRSTSSTENS